MHFLAVVFLLAIADYVFANIDNEIICEAKSQCIYIDPERGNDDNKGTFASPLKSFKNLNYYSQNRLKPNNWMGLKDGDFIYLMSGTLRPSELQQASVKSSSKHSPLINIRGINAKNGIVIKAYPGESPILDAQGKQAAVLLYQGANFTIEDLEIRNSYHNGIKIAEMNNVILNNVHVYDTDGVDNDNIAGIHLVFSNNITIKNSIIHDNYDRTNMDTQGRSTENSRNIVIFRGSNITIKNNLIYQTPKIHENIKGECVTYKHASSEPNTYYKVYGNYFENCAHYGIGSGSPNTHVHHNIIVGSNIGFTTKNFGGTTFQQNIIFEYNTLYDVVIGLYATYSKFSKGHKDPKHKNLIFKNNIVVQAESGSTNDENSIVTIDPYILDEEFDKFYPAWIIDNNCYQKLQGIPEFGFGASDGSSFGPKGSIGDLRHWQEKYGFDINSKIADIKLDNEFRATDECSEIGAYQGGYLPRLKKE